MSDPNVISIGSLIRQAPCFACDDTKTMNMAEEGEPEDMAPCPQCCAPKMTSVGLTYVAMGCHGGGVILETDCDILAEEASDCGSTIDMVGLDEPPDVGIWKAVVSYWGSKDYWGEYDSGYNAGEWVQVESYPEPDCALLSGGDRCGGMLAPRDDDEKTWACDEHAGRVS